MSTLDLLQAARDLLDANELCQGRYQRPCEDDPSKMGYCALGALIYADFTATGYSMARVALADALPDDRGTVHGWPSVSEWNDEPGRTKDEVLALYDRAIESERRNV